MFTVALICGGPSPERGISLNSARSVLDHLCSDSVHIQPFFVDQKCAFFAIPPEQLYSNTTADFDFRLREHYQALSEADLRVALSHCDIVLPLIHGTFGEDGVLAQKLEAWNIPFIGNSSSACAQAYHKDKAQAYLSKNKLPVLPYFVVEPSSLSSSDLDAFWQKHVNDKAILKPTAGGSSIDVYVMDSPEAVRDQAQILFSRHERLLVQPFYRATELSLTVLENGPGNLVALPPTSTEILHVGDNIFTYRAKYLPSYTTHNYTPAPLPVNTLQDIQDTACKIFRLFGLRDFARFDGWYDSQRGFICFDINPMSGLEESNFFFKQAACCGLNHSSVLSLILKNACARNHITLPQESSSTSITKQSLPVIFGGASTERQVSVMSGRNVWLKLQRSNLVHPYAVFLDRMQQVWHIPYALALHHTVEEIEADIENYRNRPQVLRDHLAGIASSLGTTYHSNEKLDPIPLEAFVQSLAQNETPMLFLGLHGGIGEDGSLQQTLDAHDVTYNGCGPQAAAICMDKALTRSILRDADIDGVISSPQYVWSAGKSGYSEPDWHAICTHTQHEGPFIIKPLRDGCSSGIVRIENPHDLAQYADFMAQKISSIPVDSFSGQPQPVDIDVHAKSLLIEPYVITDAVTVSDLKLHHSPNTGWLELTVVVLEQSGQYQALTPSITVSESAVLSVEEKFQGGTGINLTPPPKELLQAQDLERIRDLVCQCAKALGIRQYARLDIFYHRLDQCMQVIEANTLPALTPSTVLFQQALACEKPLQPRQFLEKLIQEAMVRTEKVV